MRAPKLRELREAVTSLFSRPFTTGFPATAHTPAARFRGRPMFNKDVCVGCTACAQVCPARAIDVVDAVSGALATRTLVHHPERCIFCGHCEAHCITKEGIHLTAQFDISYTNGQDITNSIEHELVVCGACGSIIGTRRHLLWIARRLGEAAFANSTLLASVQHSIEIASAYREEVSVPLQRQDALKVICQKCRRIAFLTDEGIADPREPQPEKP